MSRNRHTDFLASHSSILAPSSMHSRRVYQTIRFFSFNSFLVRLASSFEIAPSAMARMEKPLTLTVSFFQRIDHNINIVWNLWNQDDICASCDSCMKSQPAHLMPHHLYDKTRLVGCCCGMDTVDGIRCYIHCTLNPKVISVPHRSLSMVFRDTIFRPSSLNRFGCFSGFRFHQETRHSSFSFR